MSEVIVEPDELGALMIDVRAVTEQINNRVVSTRGQTPATPMSPDISLAETFEALFYGKRPNQPTWDMLTQAASHVLLDHVLTAQEGPLAAMGERARKHQALLTGLGQAGLAKHLHMQLPGIVMAITFQKLWGENRSGLSETLAVNECRRVDAPDSVVIFGGLRSNLTKDRRQVSRAIKDIVFGGTK